ncbi:tolB protein precursor protein [Myxococcaceae bacterium GXIMD 01537]
MNRRYSAAAVLALLLPGMAFAQVYVIPRRPEKSAVHSFEFQWRHVDILVGPHATGMAKPAEHTAHDAPPGTPGAPPSNVPALGPSSEAPPGPGAAPPSPAPSVEVTEVPDGGTVAGVMNGGADGGTLAAAAPDGGADGGTSLALMAPDASVKYATSLGAATGGVRFYFYERERAVAERAAPVVEDAYRYLVDKFRYVPTETFPYILYSSYAEFLQTNVFAVSEGTLGVTSTEDLKLSLPYLGDHKLFEEVSTHELTHQFTIQKVRTVTGDKVFGDPLASMPLWFIEGLAEFYAKRGLDPETEMLARDLMVNPDLMKGYAFLDFFSPGPYGFLWIYKVGQMRVAFLEEEYGSGFTQKVLEASPRLVSGGGMPGSSSMTFEVLLQQLTGDSPKKISARFENWMKKRAFKSYLTSQQSAPVMELLEERPGIITAFTSGPDGRLLMFRTIVPETGQSRLYIGDARAQSSVLRVQGDGIPGYESLHPISGRNFAISSERIVFVAESNARDVLYVQQYKHKAEQQKRDVLVRPTQLTAGIQAETAFLVDIDLGKRVAYPLVNHGLLAAYSPAFSPDGKKLAFIGISDEGVRDVYVLDLEKDAKAPPVRMTNDVYSERQISWGPSGIIFTSDATSHRNYNLFRVRPDAPGKVERLTSQETDEADPLHLPDGRIFFVAYSNGSTSDLHELMPDGRIVRRTDVNTGVFEPAPGPDGSLWMLFHQAGERRPATLRPEKMLALPVESEAVPEAAPPMAARKLEDATPYEPFAWKNLELGPIMGFAGAGGGAFVGQVYAAASDKLKNHALLLSLAVYGSFDLTDGYLIYLNQEKRTTWGGGLFQSLRFRVDETFPDSPFLFSSGERFFGAMGSARYPLNTYFYLQGDLSIGGTSYFLDDMTEFILYTDATGDLYTAWNRANRGVRFQTETSVQVGYNTLHYHYLTGPLAGSSAMLEATVDVQPFHSEVFGNVRLDGEHYIPIYGRANLALRGGTGTTFGGRFARSYFLYSFDTLRGVNFGDETWLLGRNFFFSTAEVQLPLNDIIRVAFLSDVEAIIGMDFGGVGNTASMMWDKRVLNFVVGGNVLLGPLLLRLHFARPIGVGSPFGKPDPDWVTNFSLGFAGLNGFFDSKSEAPPSRRSVMPGGTGYTSPRGAY